MLCSHFSVDLIGNNVQRSDASPSQTWASVHSPAQQRCPDLLFCTLGPCKDNGLCLWSVAKNTHWENGDPLSPSRVSKPDGRFLILVGLQLSQGSKKYKSVSAGMSEWLAEFPPAGQGSNETRPSNQGLHKTIEAALNLKFFPEWAARHKGWDRKCFTQPRVTIFMGQAGWRIRGLSNTLVSLVLWVFVY